MREPPGEERREILPIQPRESDQLGLREAHLLLFGQFGQMFRVDGLAPLTCLTQGQYLLLLLPSEPAASDALAALLPPG